MLALGFACAADKTAALWRIFASRGAHIAFIVWTHSFAPNHSWLGLRSAFGGAKNKSIPHLFQKQTNNKTGCSAKKKQFSVTRHTKMKRGARVAPLRQFSHTALWVVKHGWMLCVLSSKHADDHVEYIYTLGLDTFPEIVSAANHNDIYKLIFYSRTDYTDIIKAISIQC
jgi:hypothetical protein